MDCDSNDDENGYRNCMTAYIRRTIDAQAAMVCLFVSQKVL